MIQIEIDDVEYVPVVSVDKNGVPIKTKNGDPATLVVIPESFAGERLISSLENSYLSVVNECQLTIIKINTAVTLGGGAANDANLIGVQITTDLNGTCIIGGFKDNAGVAATITLPSGTLAGFYNYYGAQNTAGALTVKLNNGLDYGDVQVLWRARV